MTSSLCRCCCCHHFDGSRAVWQIFSWVARQQKERGSNLRWSPSTVRALPGMCPNRSSGRDHREMIAPRENSIVVSALAVIGNVETFALRFHGGTKTDDHVDELVEDRRSNAGPEQRGTDGLALRNHLGDEVVGTG